MMANFIHINKSSLERIFIAVIFIFITSNGMAFSQQTKPDEPTLQIPKVSINLESSNKSNDLVLTLQILAITTILTLAPSILIMMTSFTRIVIVFYFLRQALGTATQPPTQVLTGLALFLTIFVMQPTLNEANKNGIQPYLKNEITQQQAVHNIVQPFRNFMLKHTREEDLGLFIKLSGKEKPHTIDDVSTLTIIPAFTISELKIAFQIGFLLFIPFLVLDMIVASTLMSLGMFLLPPQLISLPIKVLLFILVDGWNLLITSLMNGIMKT
ncbi:MAG TPA: flagellar type III secretion system pore protein FliP [Candidatus Kapabacteria bacterium]|jgi:flagellar biosynthetic protein FliP|nr:flagellar type III secretion system pore protein FliP [Candidatus Kapabacteria bacterium]